MNQYLLVDGYNIIFAWDELKEMAEENLDAARLMLQDTLSELQGYTKETIILVFDGYKVKGNPGTVITYHNIYVIFTKEAETADQYIEKATGQYTKEGHVRVATSDWLEQVIIMGQGGERISARDLRKEVKEMKKYLRKNYTETIPNKRNSLIDNLSPEMAELMKEMRLQETEDENIKEEKKLLEKQQKKKQEQKKQQKPVKLDLTNLIPAETQKTEAQKKQEKKIQNAKIPHVVNEKEIKKNNLKKKKKQKKEQKNYYDWT